MIWNKLDDAASHVGQKHFIGYILISQSNARKIHRFINVVKCLERSLQSPPKVGVIFVIAITCECDIVL